MPDDRQSKTDQPPSDTAASIVISGDRTDNAPAGGNRPETESTSDLPFRRLCHYEVVGWIGHGGMGDVYRGYERALDRTVALKVLPRELSVEPEFVRRFHAEASAAARVVHPHVIQIHFIGEDAGHHFFAMQYVDGESLAGLLARRGRLGITETLDILEQVLSGLGAAHRQGLIHRDIKPGNILLDRVHQRALLADFGLVKSLAAVDGRTATGVVMGTVDYIAPEQGRGLPVDHRVDLYAVGVLAYQMLSGRLPFSADSPTALIFQHVYEPAPPLADDVPPALAAVVAKLMAKSRESRHASAEAVLADLQAVRTRRPLPSGADVELAVNPQAFLQAAVSVAAPSTSTRIIRAPQFSDDAQLPNEPWLSDVRQPESASTWWSRVRTWCADWLRSRTPEWVQQMQSTQQQVGGAVAEYERRRDQLRSLVHEADDVLTALRSALSTRPDDADLQRAAADQEEQLGEMRLRLSQVEATLRQLCHQRDLLQARLKSAHAKLHLAGKPVNRPRSRRGFVVAIVIMSCVIFALVALPPLKRWLGDSNGGNVSASAPDVPLITEILKAPTVTADLSVRVQRLAFGSTDGLFGVVKEDTDIELRDGKTGLPLKRIETKAKDAGDVVIDHEGNHAASVVRNGQSVSLSIWDTRQGSQSVVSTDLHGSVRLLGFAGTPSHLMLTQTNGDQVELLRWPLDGKPPVHLAGMADLIGTVAFDSTGNSFSISRSTEVLLGEFAINGNSPASFKSISAAATAVVFHPHDGTLAFGSSDGSVTIWDFALRQPIRQLVGPSTTISALAIDDTGRWLAASDGERVRIWDLGLLYVRSIIPISNVTALAYSPGGKELALIRDSSQVQLWNTDFPLMEIRFGPWLDRLSQEQRDRIRNQYSAALQEYNPREATTHDGHLTAVAAADKIPFLKDAQSGKRLYEFEGARSSLGIAISSDDRMVAIGSYDSQSGTGDVRMWNLRTGRQLGEFAGHIHYAWSVAFSNDDSRLLSGGRRAMHLWDVRTQTEVRRFEAPFTFVKRVVFSPDGRRASASADLSPTQQHALFDCGTGEALLRFSGMPPEFVFGPPAAYADQRFGVVHEMGNAGSSGGVIHQSLVCGTRTSATFPDVVEFHHQKRGHHAFDARSDRELPSRAPVVFRPDGRGVLLQSAFGITSESLESNPTGDSGGDATSTED